MLLRFVFENFLSFKKTTTLDFEAASIREFPENTATFSLNSLDFRILKSAALYGANSSGKSNILKAFMFARNFILTSSDTKIDHQLLVRPYRLDSDTDKKPSLFEISIIIDSVCYRYGFLLTKELVISEWLYITEKRKEELLFKRDEGKIEIEKKFKAESNGQVGMIFPITKKNALFLSTLGQFASLTAGKILDWVEKSIIILSSDSSDLLNYTANLLEQPYYQRRITEIIGKADLSFSSIQAEVKEKANRSGFDEWIISALYNSEHNYKIKTIHKKYKSSKHVGNELFDLTDDESLGSQKFVLLLGPLLKAIKENAVIWIDELDARLHTNLLLAVLKFFNSQTNNPLGAQLIYSSHNSNLLQKHLRRDQMIFVKQEAIHGSTLTTLHNFDSKIRSDASFDKDYLAGKYGAIPKIDLSPDLFD